MTWRGTENSQASYETWKVRPSPRRARRATGQPVTSSPSSTTRPASGLRPPASWAIRVDLPAPLGPISAWISPGSTARSMPSVAFKAPKALCRPCSSSSASVMARLSGEQADDAAAREEHHGQQDEAEHELPAVGPAADESPQQEEERESGQAPGRERVCQYV